MSTELRRRRSAALATLFVVYAALVLTWRYAPVSDIQSPSAYLLFRLLSGPASMAVFLGQEPVSKHLYWFSHLAAASTLLLAASVGVAYLRPVEMRFAALGLGFSVWTYYGLWLALMFF